MGKDTKEQVRPYHAITGNCFINAPYEQLRRGLLEYFVEKGLQPEIGLEGDCLWEVPEREFLATADTLRRNNLACTLHAPFFDLAPGALDPKIRAVTRHKLRLAFELIPVFRPRSIVCHLGYEENKHSYKMDEWLRYSIETWHVLIEIASANGTPVMFENTYETGPDIHHLLFSKLSSPSLGFCLDTGHLSAYAGTSWQPWLDMLLPRLGQLHLHDNNGGRDEHLAVGSGSFRFGELFDFLRENGTRPLVTLEPHTREDLWLSLKNIGQQDLLRGILAE
jgi:sugar phosphate isomerase/epimerase